MTPKDLLRREVRAAIRSLDPVVRAQASARIVDRLRTLLPSAGLVLAYVPLPDEVDIRPLLVPLGRSRRLALPRVVDDGLAIHRVANPETDLAPGAFGIGEPDTRSPLLDEDVAAVLVPGRAFDRTGARLGRGSAYYDRFLGGAKAALRIGVAFDVQLLDHVPTEPHDLPMDVVVTEREVVRPGACGL